MWFKHHHPLLIIMRHTRLLIVSTVYPARVTLLCVCHLLACLLHKCVREEKCVRACVLVEVTIIPAT